MTFNHGLTFYSIPDDLTSENVKRTFCLDHEAPFCALGDEELFISVTQAREKLDFLLTHLLEMANSYSQTATLPVNYDIVFETVSQAMANGGKVLLFAAATPSTGKSTLAMTTPDDGKSDKTRYFPKVVLDSTERILDREGTILL